ncbi:MAG: RHS repeat-associated core domain-containing protein, partial [Rhodanobacteraceae bacterium]|nr:RHS repeat-associated core domain-containing protein [Rhodanobacteraceae bacterium]
TSTQYLAPFTTQYSNARNKITSTTFQVFDEPSESAPLTISEPLNTTTTYTRDVFGKPLTLKRSGTFNSSPVSLVRHYVYDADQLLCKTIEPESSATVISYNLSHQIEWKASGQPLTSTSDCQRTSVTAADKISYDYDGRERLWRTRYGDNSPSVTVTFTPDGLPETVQSDNSTWTTRYNRRRLMTSETLNLSGNEYPLSYSYTPNGHVASLRYPDGAAVTYAPNALGEATQVGNYASSITRHPNGALATLTYGNGITHTTLQNLRNLPSRSTDSGVLDDGYTYDENANVATITDHLNGQFTRSMGYDDRDRLTSASNGPLWGGTHTFTYDPLDNLRRSVNPTFGDWTFVYNATTQRLDRIEATGGAALITYGYDTHGRATARTTSGAAQTFVVDLADRVTAVNPATATYRYDGHGRRTQVTKAGSTTAQVYSQAGQLMYQSSDGIFRNGFQTVDTPYSPNNGNRRYIYLGRHLIAEDGTTGRQYLHTDALGSPVRTSNTAGVLSGRDDYKPYGWGPPPQSKPNFTGHVADAETGLIYMQARYYDPYAGRFMATDAVAATPVSFNRYWYANNNPYKNVDPDGREAGSFYTNPQYQMAGPQGGGAVVVIAIGFVPIVGDAVAIGQAIASPTMANIVGAGVGLVPGFGDVAAKFIKGADRARDATIIYGSSGSRVGEYTAVMITGGLFSGHFT